MLKFYVINLASRFDRWEEFQRINHHIMPYVERFKAIKTCGALDGCTMSHMHLWNYAPCIICEDDAIFSYIIPWAYGRADLISFGFNFNAQLRADNRGFRYAESFDIGRFQTEAKEVAYYRLQEQYGTPAYYISEAGAVKLKSFNFSAMRAIDVQLNEVYAKLDAWVTVPPLVATRNIP